MKWLEAFEGVQAATEEKDAVSAQNFLSEVESRIAVTPADGLRGLVIKLGLHQFFNEHANAASMQVDSAYAGLVPLTDMIRRPHGSKQKPTVTVPAQLRAPIPLYETLVPSSAGSRPCYCGSFEMIDVSTSTLVTCPAMRPDLASAPHATRQSSLVGYPLRGTTLTAIGNEVYRQL